MKIICLEEHTTDPAIGKAIQPAMMADAGYMSQVGDDAEDDEDDRPHQISMKTAMALAGDMGAGRLAEMDRHGIDMQVVSYSNPTQIAPANEAAGLARAANDRLAQAVRANPTRFAAFATLPWQHPQQAATELDRAVHELGMVGTLLIGRPGQTFLDDPLYEPVLAKLAELKVPLYVHPGVPLPQVQQPYYGGLKQEVSARFSVFGWGWHNEAGVHVIRMILSGIFDRHPNLQVISGHWGELVPFYLQRLDDTMNRKVTGLSRTITDTYKAHVTVTPSGMLTTPHFEFIHKVLGADRIMYAVDYPYVSNTGARKFLEELSVSQDEKEKIGHGNAERVLGVAV